MANDFATMRGVLDSLKAAGPDAAEPVLDAIDAAKRYLFGEAAKQGDNQPYQGPNGPTPTVKELAELIDGLRGWAVLYASTCDTDPLLTFRQVELSRLSLSGAIYASGLISCGMPASGDWARAAQRADQSLNELSAVVVERREGQGDRENGPGVVDLDQIAAFFHLQKPSAGNSLQRTNEFLARLAGLLQDQEDRRTHQGNEDAGPGQGGDACQTESLSWIKVSQAEKISRVSRGFISRLADAGRIRSNGKNNTARRISTLDFIGWLLSRDKRPEPQESAAQVDKLVTRHVKK